MEIGYKRMHAGNCVSHRNHQRHDEGEARWENGEYTWSNRYEGSDGSWSRSSGAFASDGSGTMRYEDSLGYRTTFQYNSDGSGQGRIEGPDPRLPAVITWDAEGNVRIEWADGMVEEFNWFSTGVVQPMQG